MLKVSDLAVGYGATPVLEGINLDIATGEFTSLIGPSGSGKTSILRVVTKLLEPLRGAIELDVAVHDVGFLFQDDALLPWRTVRQNVALGLRIRNVPLETANDKADHWLTVLGLDGYGDRYPQASSYRPSASSGATLAPNGRALRLVGRNRPDTHHSRTPAVGRTQTLDGTPGHPRS